MEWLERTDFSQIQFKSILLEKIIAANICVAANCYAFDVNYRIQSSQIKKTNSLSNCILYMRTSFAERDYKTNL